MVWLLNDFDPSLHTGCLMTQHMTVHEPFSRVVEDADDIVGLLTLQKRRVAIGAKTAVFQNFVKVMPVQVDAMGKAGVIDQLYSYGLPTGKRLPRGRCHAGHAVKAPDVTAVVRTTHRAALHAQH